MGFPLYKSNAIRVINNNELFKLKTGFASIYDLNGLPDKSIDLILSAKDFDLKIYTLKPTKILTVSGDSKTIKGLKLGFLTGILYLSPFKIAGVNLCSAAELAMCHLSCLNESGRGSFDTNQIRRLRKTLFFLQFRDDFDNVLIKDISRLQRRSINEELTPVVRLNGTSDIKFEKHIIKSTGHSIIETFPLQQFYDYTKLKGRKVPANYDLTFSFSGATEAYIKYFIKNVKGQRVSVVFRTADIIPKTFLGMPVIPGDNSDIRHTEPLGSVVALYEKKTKKNGKQVSDTTGFVLDVADIARIEEFAS